MATDPPRQLDARVKAAIRACLNPEEAERAVVERIRAERRQEGHTREGLAPLPEWGEGAEE